MAGGYNLAQAYVQIMPSAKNFKSNLTSAIGPDITAAGDEAGNKFGSGFSGSISKLGLVAAGAAAAAGAALVSLGKDAVEAYAEYEQLVGGVETLFGSASELVLQHATEAYKTAGLSANDYMTTVTSFAASLKQSVGTEAEAAKVANMAVTDMSDNANKMGTSMESIQNAYQGFAKQNYTMLDNLKLGYGGTKQEMERLLADAQKITGIEYDISNLSDVYNAIHVIQTELGITGTTAEEAEHTISGSASALKAAWTNLKAGLGNPSADVKALTKDVVGSFNTLLDNALPVIKNISSALPEMMEEGMDDLPQILNKVIPIAEDVGDSIIVLFRGTIDNFPEILESGARLGAELFGSVITELPGMVWDIISNIPDMFVSIFDGAKRGFAEAFGDETLIAIYDSRDAIADMKLNTDELSRSLENLNDKRGAEYISIQSQVEIYRDLLNNLKKYTDGSGNVVEGYEKEFSALQALAEQYGINIEVIDGQVQGYDELKQSVEDLIVKYQEEAYVAAETAQLEEAYNIKREAMQGYEEAYRQYQENMLGYYDALSTGDMNLANMYEANMAEAQARMSEYETTVLTADANIELANYNMAVAAAGDFTDIAYTIEGAGIQIAEKSADIENTQKRVTNTLQEENQKRLSNAIDSGNQEEEIISRHNKSALWLFEQYGEDRVKAMAQHNLELLAEAESGGTYLLAEQKGLAKDLREQMVPMLQDSGSEEGAAYVNGIADALDAGEITVQKAAELIAKGAEDGFKNPLEIHSPSMVMYRHGQNVAQGLANGIGNGESTVIGSVTSLARSAIATAKSWLGIHSPSTVFAEIGGFTAEGYADGIIEKAHLASEAAGAMADEAIEAASDRMAELDSAITDISDMEYSGTLAVTGGDQTSSGIGLILDLLLQYLPELAEMSGRDIVFDDGTLVARIAPRMNDALGELSTMESRGVA